MTAAKCSLVGLALVLLGGCVIRDDNGGAPRFDRGQGEFRDQGRGQEQGRGEEQGRGPERGPGPDRDYRR